MRSTEILCIGHTTLDTFLYVDDAQTHCDIKSSECKVCFEFGAKIAVNDVSYGIGGGAANVSAGLKKLDTTPLLYTIIGNDPKGTDIKRHLYSIGLSHKYVYEDSNPTDQSMIISYTNERTIFSYNHDRKYNIDKLYNFKVPQYIFISSIGKDITQVYNQVIDLKRLNPGLTVFLSPGTKEIRDSVDDIANILPSVDYLLSNVEEGCSILNPSLNRSQISPKDLADLLVQKGIGSVVLTDGGDGVYFADKEDLLTFKAIKVDVVEKTGAGDAFASGFVGALMHGQDKKDAVKWGIANSSSVIQTRGAQNGLMDVHSIEELAQTVLVAG